MAVSLRRVGVYFGLMIIVALLVAGAFLLSLYESGPELRQQNARTTSLYPIVIEAIPVVLDEGRGGGIAMLGESLIYAMRDGRFFIKDGASNEFEAMSLRLPMQVSELASRFKRAVDIHAVGLKGVGARERNGMIEVFALHHHLFEEKECYVLRLSKALLEPSQLRGASVVADWTPLFDSTPCLPTSEYSLPIQSGGRISFLSEREVLITVGDFNLISSQGDKGPYPQDLDASYGKIIMVDADTGQSSVYSWGHRNPQGLVIARDGTIWETEHGPRGGDEINEIVAGENYGWPARTFGTDSDKFSWSLSDTPGSHAGYRYPLYSFLPSIGISNIIEVVGDEFPFWRGDLLVSSLGAQSLYRVRVRDGRAMFAERIIIGARVRDIEQSPSGVLYLKIDDEAQVLVVTRGEMPEAASTTSGVADNAAIPSGLDACAGCHTLRAGQPHDMGPNLWNIYDREIASFLDYDYSPALKSRGGTWGDDELRAFLADPDSFAAGTKMTPQDLSEQEIAEAIAALKALR